MFSPTPSSISRTVQYRKITKPLLERKRRARINRCLDELKDLMFTALEAEGENVDKLEKADILEFTVKHLQKITRRDPVEEAYKFQEGFSHCASEACSFLLSLPGLDSVVGRRLVEYLAKSVSRALESQVPAAAAASVSKPMATAAASATAPSDSGAGSIHSGPDTPGHTPPPSHTVTSGHTPTSDHATPSGHAPTSGHASPPAQACVVQQQQQAALRKPVALTASNRGHVIIRPKPTRPFGPRDVQHAMQRDPMWRPW